MNDISRVKQALRRLPQFESLAEDIQRVIAEAAFHRHYESGQVIYVEGEPAQWIYILEAGWIKATRMTRQGREQAMMFLRPTEVFGDIAILAGTPYPGTVVALESVEVWAIPAQVILDLIQRQPTVAMAVIHHLAERVLHYISLVEDLSLRSVEARLAHTLLLHAEIQDGRLIVPRRDWTTFDEMAVRLGTVRDVLSRSLKMLEAENLLKVEKQHIVLLDPDRLAERANH